MEYILLIVGFVLLIKGADLFVEGSSNVAKFFKIPSIVIGLTLVAFGTSAPEAAVSITASLNHSADLSISNIIGSNLFNLLIVLGLTAIFKDVVTKNEVIKNDYKFALFGALLLLGLILVNYLISGNLVLNRIGGILLLVSLGYYLYNLIKGIKDEDKIVEAKKLSIKDIIFIVIGLIAVIAGGNITVDSATTIARNFGLSERFIGLTVVAIGTSLPELCTSLVALFKGEEDIAVGNVIGSNIFNILFILGASSVLTPLGLNIESVIDLMILIVASIGVLLFVFDDLRINKKEGTCMLLFYFTYCIYIFMR